MKMYGTQVLKTGTVLMAGAALLGSSFGAPAQAHKNAERGDNLKKGAIALGALGAYLGIRGKTLPAVAAGAGAYYLYKKGRREDRDDNYPNNNRRSDNHNDRHRDRHDDRRDNGRYDNDRYDNDRYDNSGYGHSNDNNYPGGYQPGGYSDGGNRGRQYDGRSGRAYDLR